MSERFGLRGSCGWLAYSAVTGHLPRTSGLTPPVARCPAQCAYAAWQMVLMDAGGELHGYASDITRTWPVRGRFSAAQAELYEAALAVNKACIQVPGLFCARSTQAVTSTCMIAQAVPLLAIKLRSAVVTGMRGLLGLFVVLLFARRLASSTESARCTTYTQLPPFPAPARLPL